MNRLKAIIPDPIAPAGEFASAAASGATAVTLVPAPVASRNGPCRRYGEIFLPEAAGSGRPQRAAIRYVAVADAAAVAALAPRHRGPRPLGIAAAVASSLLSATLVVAVLGTTLGGLGGADDGARLAAAPPAVPALGPPGPPRLPQFAAAGLRAAESVSSAPEPVAERAAEPRVAGVAAADAPAQGAASPTAADATSASAAAPAPSIATATPAPELVAPPPRLVERRPQADAPLEPPTVVTLQPPPAPSPSTPPDAPRAPQPAPVDRLAETTPQPPHRAIVTSALPAPAAVAAETPRKGEAGKPSERKAAGRKSRPAPAPAARRPAETQTAASSEPSWVESYLAKFR